MSPSTESEVYIILSTILNLITLLKNMINFLWVFFLCFRHIKNKNPLFLFQKLDNERTVEAGKSFTGTAARVIHLFTAKTDDQCPCNIISSFNRTCLLNRFIALHGIMTLLLFITGAHEITRDALSFLYFFQTMALFVNRVWWQKQQSQLQHGLTWTINTSWMFHSEPKDNNHGFEPKDGGLTSVGGIISRMPRKRQSMIA